MANLIAETNGTRAIYQRMDANGGVAEDASRITLPVIAWDADGYALVAHGDLGQLVRAADAAWVFEEGYDDECRFLALDRSSSATGLLSA
ncbi:hypothetical protein A5719_10335 [Mycolicibacterium peregrinum]|uniref:hypothetical protein n=1 Tax=Mycolicibacterium peregrinum TaxID=43304 RepID=UPI0007E9DD2B|nr:hypothetical protein [Mycolicibacterium peregrinum]OBF42832.1 hypothetical protein A5719_10335 [Mycolicibacterium peregrinum]